MAHNTEVVDVFHVSDTQISIKLRCCADATTDSVHTIEVSGEHTEADLQAWLDGRHAHVQGLHANRDAAKAFFENLQKKTS